MTDRALLAKVETALASVWGGTVKVSLLSTFEEHPHVVRLAVQQAPPASPQTVILKRARIQGEERFSPDHSANHLLLEWANIRFLSAVMAHESPAPQVHYGDQDEGFLVLEDLGAANPLDQALWGDDPARAAQVLVRYGELLGQLHGATASRHDEYAGFQRQLNPDYPPSFENYHDILRVPVEKLKRLGFDMPPLALDEVSEAAEALSHPASFAALTHGDPVFGNVIDWQGRWRLIDFEAGRFRNALLEGSYPRMFFPTSGLGFVMRIPEAVWRQSEHAYRKVLSQHLPATLDDTLYGTAITSACAFWTLSFCHRWLPRALDGEGPPDMIIHIRRCAVTRFEQFVTTSREFQSLTHLGDLFEGLLEKLRAQWGGDAENLPYYPAFSV